MSGNNGPPQTASPCAQKVFAEYFAGIGLVRMGLERAGWSIAFANDIDPQKLEMYQAQFPNANHHFVLGDINNLTTDHIPSTTLATASFPCNDLSLAGSRGGLSGKKSSAFWGFVRILREMRDKRPPIVLLENVLGFLTSRAGEDFKQAMISLNELGYSTDAFVLDAVRFVPQSRQRLFIVGIQDCNTHQTISDTRLTDVRPKALVDYIERHPEIRWNIRDLPNQPECSLRLQDVIEDLPDDAPQWWSRERSVYLLNQMSERHRMIAHKMIVGDDWSYGTVYRRMRHGKSMAELRTDGIAGCLRTPRGGSGRQILFKAGKGTYTVRLITPREAARLMGADDYIVSVPLNQALFGFGDAVCVPAIEWIAEYYLNPIVDEAMKDHGLDGKPLEVSA